MPGKFPRSGLEKGVTITIFRGTEVGSAGILRRRAQYEQQLFVCAPDLMGDCRAITGLRFVGRTLDIMTRFYFGHKQGISEKKNFGLQ